MEQQLRAGDKAAGATGVPPRDTELDRAGEPSSPRTVAKMLQGPPPGKEKAGQPHARAGGESRGLEAAPCRKSALRV